MKSLRSLFMTLTPYYYHIYFWKLLYFCRQKMLIHICQILGHPFCLKIRETVSWQICSIKIYQILTNKKMTTQQKKQTLYRYVQNFKLSHYKLCIPTFKTLHSGFINFQLWHYKLYISRYKTLNYDIINFVLLGSKLYTQDS